MGRLISIATAAETRATMATTDRVAVTAEAGIEGDARGKPGHRQVTALSRESWADTCADLGTDVEWTLRRANLLVEGVHLPETKGKRLRVGTALLEVTGETVPCGRMDEQHPGLSAALKPDWRGGVTCRVLEGGVMAAGDAVEFEA